MITTAKWLILLPATLIMAASCGSGSSSGGHTEGTATASAETGEMIYKRTCIACHQANGEGIATSFPPLAHSDYIADVEKTITQVIKGSAGEITVNGKTFNNTMPPQQLSDEEVAKVLTFVYQSFGNAGKAIAGDDVKKVRGKM